jgi:group I intron endonuclease
VTGPLSYHGSMGCVYQLVFPNSKSYVGLTTKSAEVRYRRHIALSKGKSRRPIYNAIRKHGAPEMRILFESFEQALLEEQERRFIAELRTMVPNGYNTTAGGDGITGYQFTTEDRAKMSRPMSEANRREKSLLMKRIRAKGSVAARHCGRLGGHTRYAQNPERKAVLAALRERPMDSNELSARTGTPRPSVNSMIYRLRKEGYQIISSGRRGVLGKFTLIKEPSQNVSGD